MERRKKTTPLPFLSLLLAACALAALPALNGCGGKPDPAPEPTEAERVTALLTAGKWNPATPANWVTVDGVDVADLFKDFTITFTATGLTTTGTTPVWPRTDTWKFKANSTTVLVRASDSLEITVESLDDKTLKLSLFWNQETTDGGRAGSIMGKHLFSFAR